MGEIADMLIDQMVERGAYYSRTRPQPKCRRCGETDVYWLDVSEIQDMAPRYVLCDFDGTTHQCKPNADGFEDVTNA